MAYTFHRNIWSHRQLDGIRWYHNAAGWWVAEPSDRPGVIETHRRIKEDEIPDRVWARYIAYRLAGD